MINYIFYTEIINYILYLIILWNMACWLKKNRCGSSLIFLFILADLQCIFFFYFSFHLITVVPIAKSQLMQVLPYSDSNFKPLYLLHRCLLTLSDLTLDVRDKASLEDFIFVYDFDGYTFDSLVLTLRARWTYTKVP